MRSASPGRSKTVGNDGNGADIILVNRLVSSKPAKRRLTFPDFTVNVCRGEFAPVDSAQTNIETPGQVISRKGYFPTVMAEEPASLAVEKNSRAMV